MSLFKPLLVATLVLGGGLCGCAATTENPDAEPPQPPAEPTAPPDSMPELPAGATAESHRPFEELVRQFRTHSGLDSRERLAISSQEQWAPLRLRLGQRNPPREALPDPDFGQEQLLVAAMGSQPSSGYSIRITGVWRSEGVRYVSVQEVSPRGCVVLTELTQPVDAVLVPRSDEPVRFLELPTIFPCGPG